MTFVVHHSMRRGHSGHDPYVQYDDAEKAFRDRVRDQPGSVVRLVAWSESGQVGAPLMEYDPHADIPHRWQDTLTGLSPDRLRRAAQIGLAAIVLALDATDTTPEMTEVLESAKGELESVL